MSGSPVGHHRLGIDFISVHGLNPVEFVALARSLECPAIGMAPTPITSAPGMAPWNLREDAALVADLKRALAEHQVSISIGDGFLILPGADIASAEADLDLMASLGTELVNICGLDPELARNIDQFGRFAEMAAARGMQATIEFLPGMGVGTLDTAVAVVNGAAQPNSGVLLDAMHVLCTGVSPATVAALPAGMVRYAQLCDARAASVGPTYFDEARNDRLAPGEGVLPLADFVRALPDGCTIGLEIPMLPRAAAGIGHAERLRPAIAAARALLS